MKKINIVIYTILILAIIFLLIMLFFTKSKDNKELDNAKKNSNDVVQKINYDEKINDNENVVLLGDSITQFYKINDIYDSYKIIQSGVSGYTTDDILKRMDSMVYRYNPTKVILLIGTNDIMSDTSSKKQNETTSKIEKIAKEIKKNRPNSKMYIESIYPVNKDINKGMVSNRDNTAIKDMNKVIKKYCNNNNIVYINMFDELKDENDNFDKRYTNDGLHPNDVGYAKITRVLTPYIYE